MTFTDVYTDLYHDTYGTPVTVLTPPSLPPAPGELLKVKVRNADLEFVGSLRYTQCDARIKHNALGTWAFDIFHDGNPDDATLTLMEPGSGVSITYNGKVVLSGPMTAAKEDRTVDGIYAIQVSGTSDLQYIADRYGSPEPAKETDPDGGQVFYDETSHFTTSGPAETVVKGTVKYNLGDLTATARQAPIEIIPTAFRGDDVSLSTRFDDLLELLTNVAEQGGIGLSAIQTKEGVVTFDIYVPADKTDDIKFVDNSKHVAAYSYEVQRPTGTWVAVGGGGEGVDRTFWESGVDSGWGRIERFRDQRQTENLFALAAEAFAFLDENGDKFAFSCELIDSPDAPFRWGPAVTESGIGNFDLGDRVTIVIRGIPIEQIVREVRIQDGPGGATITPIVGTPTQSDPRDRYVRVLFDRVRDLNQRLGYQEPLAMNTLLTSSGRIYLAPWGVEIPLGLDAPGSDWTDVGLISEDGLHTVTSPLHHPRRHWNSLSPNWQFPAGVEETVTFTPLEYSEFVNVFEQTGGTWTEADEDGIRRFDPPDRTATVAWSLICDATDESWTVRTVLERCIVTSPIDRVFNATTMTTSEITLALCSVPGTTPWWQYDNGEN